MRGRHASRRREELGQSLVETALVLPLLLMLLLGITEVARMYYYTTMTASAAREGAAYASRHASDPDVAAQVERRACYETGLVAYNSSPPCPAGVTVVTQSDPSTGDLVVEVGYQFKLLFEFKLLAGQFANILPATLEIRAEARVPNLTN